MGSAQSRTGEAPFVLFPRRTILRLEQPTITGDPRMRVATRTTMEGLKWCFPSPTSEALTVYIGPLVTKPSMCGLSKSAPRKVPSRECPLSGRIRLLIAREPIQTSERGHAPLCDGVAIAPQRFRLASTCTRQFDTAGEQTTSPTCWTESS